MKIRVHIDRIVVDPALASQTPHPILLRDAIRAELGHLAGGPAASRSVALGRDIAISIHENMTRRAPAAGPAGDGKFR